MPDRLRGARRRIDANDRVDLRGRRPAAEEVDEPSERDGGGVVQRGRQPSDTARARTRHGDDVVPRSVRRGEPAEQHRTAAERRRGGVLNGGIERTRRHGHEPLRAERSGRGWTARRRLHRPGRRVTRASATPGQKRDDGKRNECRPGRHVSQYRCRAMNGA